jgi:hypothetical protein
MKNIGAFQSKLNFFLSSALAFGCAVIIIIFVSFIIRHHYKKKYASSNLIGRNTYSEPFSRSEVEGGVSILECLFSPIVNLKKPPTILMLKKNLEMEDLELYTMVR